MSSGGFNPSAFNSGAFLASELLIIDDCIHTLSSSTPVSDYHRFSPEDFLGNLAGDELCVNNLEDVYLIAGDEKTLTYTIYGDLGEFFDLKNTVCSILLFQQHDATNLIAKISGSVIGVYPSMSTEDLAKTYPQFEIILPNYLTGSMSGVYLQQVEIYEKASGTTHIPSQGKIIVFPSIESYIP